MHAQKLVEKAKDAADRRAYDHAIEFYLQALQLDPDHGEGREGLREAELAKYAAYYPSKVSRLLGTLGPRAAAWFAGLTKNLEKKMIACERILLKDPRNVRAGLALAEAAAAAGHRRGAAAAYRGVLMSDEQNLEALKGLGRMLYALGEPKEALEAFEKALKVSPRDQDASRMRKNLAAEVSITDTGIDRSQHSRDVLRDRDEVESLEQEGRIVRSADELAESAKALEEALDRDPDDLKVIQELASRYAALKDYDRAIALYERGRKLQPSNYMWREKLGDLKIARFDRQLSAARDAGEKDKHDAIARERLAFMVEEYRARVQDHPTDLVLHFNLGRALYESGDMDGAIAEFQQTNRDPRRKIESLTMLGNCFLAKGMFDLAENQLRKALEESPGLSGRTKEILFSLGLLKEKQGRPAEALEEYKKIYEVDIHYRDVAKKIESLKKEIAGS